MVHLVVEGLGVTKQLRSLEVSALDGLGLRDLREEAVEAAVVAANGVGAEVVVGVADDWHAGCRTCDHGGEYLCVEQRGGFEGGASERPINCDGKIKPVS